MTTTPEHEPPPRAGPGAAATASSASELAPDTATSNTDADVADATPADAERRLHPMSWLFVLVAQLKQFIVPLLALLVFGRGATDGRHELWPLVGVGVLAVVSVWQYFTYRYGVSGDALVVRSGLLHRSLRVIPFARIHNVALQQSILHRLFGVAEVRLESAGGTKPEAEMRVLKLADALALEHLVRHRGAASPPAGEAAAGGNVLLALPPGEVVRLGLVSNRGLIVIGAAAAAASQASPRLLPNLFESWGQALFGWAGAQHFSPVQYALAGASFFLVFVLLLRALSVLVALLQYHGFTLSEHGRRLTVDRGLLARWRTSASRRRIQAWTLREGVLHRLLRRRSLGIDTAAGEEPQEQQRALRELAPIATGEACDALVRHLLPRAHWPPAQWQPVADGSWRRLAFPGVALSLVAATALAWRFGPWGLLALAWLPWALLAARRHASRIGYALDEAIIVVREGWWSRHWRFAEIDKLQALQLTRNPLDRRFGTATLWLDTAGARGNVPALRIPYLPQAQAQALYDALSRTLARRPLRW